MHDSPDPNTTAQTAESSADRIDDLEQLRERLAFYESFDQLINDNVTRSSELLREAAARKSEGDLALRNTTAEFEQRQLTERINYRRIFSSLLDEISTVQQNVERLARQVSDALDDLEAVIPAAGELGGIDGDQFPSMPTFSPGPAGELVSGQGATSDQSHAAADSYGDAEISAEPEESTPAAATVTPDEPAAVFEHVAPETTLEPVDEIVTADEAHFETRPVPDAGVVASGVGTPSTFPDEVRASIDRISQSIGGSETSAPAEPETATALEQERSDNVVSEPVEPLPDDGISVDLDEEPVDTSPSTEADQGDVASNAVADDWIDAGVRTATTLLVHGVPRATTALSLKRYLEGLAQVHSVEPREYAEGILRLQVSSDRPVGLDDLRGWPEAESLEPVSVSEDFVEVRLTQ